MMVVESSLGLRCCSFAKPYTYMFLAHCSTHSTSMLDFEASQKMALRNLIFVVLRNLGTFATSSPYQ